MTISIGIHDHRRRSESTIVFVVLVVVLQYSQSIHIKHVRTICIKPYQPFVIPDVGGSEVVYSPRHAQKGYTD